MAQPFLGLGNVGPVLQGIGGLGVITCLKTKRASKYAAIAWLCLLAIVVIVRAVKLPLGSVQPEAVMLTFMMTLPFTLGLTGLVIGAVWILERRGG